MRIIDAVTTIAVDKDNVDFRTGGDKRMSRVFEASLKAENIKVLNDGTVYKNGVTKKDKETMDSCIFVLDKKVQIRLKIHVIDVTGRGNEVVLGIQT